jgi:hypothetical protein
MDPSTWGWIGGIGGGLIGVLGGVLGTWMSFRATQSPAERAVLWRWAIACWVSVVLFCVLGMTLPEPYNWLIWLPYPVLLCVGILCANRALARARSQT